MSLVFDKKTNAIDICRAFAGEIKGRTVVLTGPTPGGVGYTVALDIAEQGPALMVLVGRTLSKLVQSLCYGWTSPEGRANLQASRGSRWRCRQEPIGQGRAGAV